MSKQTYIKLKSCAVKEPIIKIRRQPSKWEKIFVNDISDQGLISKIGKEFIQFNNRKESWLKMGRGSEQMFFQKRYIHGQQAHEKMFNVTNYQGNAKQNHSEISPHTYRMANIEKTRNNNCWRVCGEKETLLRCWWQCNLVKPLENITQG